MQSLSEYPEKLNSLGEVQRIIGLSLSKIQLGRNQRGGLPLHKNLLVATVLNKARDLYMQETMYINYKMMTGHQFGMPVVSGEGTSSGGGHTSGSLRSGDLQESPEQEDYEEDSESDVEDDCDTRSCEAASPRAAIAASMAYPASTMAAMMMQAAAAASSCSNNETGRLTPISPSAIAMQNSLRLQPHSGSESQQHSSEGESSTHQDDSFTAMQGSFQHLHHLSQLHHHHQQQQQQQEQMQSQSAVMVAAHAQAVAAAFAANQQQQQQQQQQVNTPAAGSDEGFIDEPDCDCDVRNFSTQVTRVPFQYCYHCAPFQSANGRGPTLVPSPSCPSMSSSNTSQVDEEHLSPMPQTLSAFHSSTSRGSSEPSSSVHYSENNFTIYDMDSKSTERHLPCDEPSRHGTKRRRKVSEAESHQDSPKKRRASECSDLDVVSTEDEPSSLTTSENSSSKPTQDEVFHPAFRNSCSEPSSNPGVQQTMEIDQITSLVSIFSFGQHIIAAGGHKDSCPAADSVSLSGETVAGPEDAADKKSAEDDSDSESDTSSDSGHSSDDHDTSSDKDKEEEGDSKTSEDSTVLTKLTQSVRTPDLCSSSVATPILNTDSPICVEVASV